MKWLTHVKSGWIVIAAIIAALAVFLSNITAIIEKTESLVKRFESSIAYIKIIFDTRSEYEILVWLINDTDKSTSGPSWLIGGGSSEFSVPASKQFYIGFSGIDIKAAQASTPVVSGKPGTTTSWTLVLKEGTDPPELALFARHDPQKGEVETEPVDFNIQYAAAWARGNLPDLESSKDAGLLRALVAVTALFQVRTPHCKEFVSLTNQDVVLGCLGFDTTPWMLQKIQEKKAYLLQDIFASDFDKFMDANGGKDFRFDRQKEFWQKIHDSGESVRNLWLSRFRTLVKTSEFQDFQRESIFEVYEKSVQALKLYGLSSQRALAMLFAVTPIFSPMSVRWGVSEAVEEFEKAQRRFPNEDERLEIFAELMSKRFPLLRHRLDVIRKGYGSVLGFVIDLNALGISSAWRLDY